MIPMVWLLLVLLADQFDTTFKAGLIALNENQLAVAESHLEAASRLQPRNARVWLALAQTYWKLNESTKAEEAATFYTSIFENSRILHVTRYGSAGPRPAGMVMTVNFELDGQEFIALNGGPEFTFDEAISFQVNCESQDEVDHFWTRLSDGGQEGPWRPSAR